MFRKYFVVRTGLGGALFLGACALVLAKCDGSNDVHTAPVVQANHKTPAVEANYAVSDLVPFTEWNDITDHSTIHLKCSGGQSVTVDNVATEDKDANGGLPTINFYEFISVSQNGFVIAKNDVPDNRYYHFGGQSQDYTGEWVGKSSAGGKNANGDEVLFILFTVRNPKNEVNKYYLNTQTLAKGGADSKFTCEEIK